jgi:hypothetical protein
MTPPRRFCGVDPGQTGAAVWLADDGLTVLHVEYWVDALTPPRLPVLPTEVVAVEDQYLGKNARSFATLVRWTERLVVGLPDGVLLVRPLATTWRAAVLRRARLGRTAAKRVALEAVRLHARGMPEEFAGLPDVAEAWCLARFAWGWAAKHEKHETQKETA